MWRNSEMANFGVNLAGNIKMKTLAPQEPNTVRYYGKD